MPPMFNPNRLSPEPGTPGETDPHLPAAPEIRSHTEVDVIGRPDPLFGELDVAGIHLQVALAVGGFAFAPQRDRAVEVAFLEPADTA